MEPRQAAVTHTQSSRPQLITETSLNFHNCSSQVCACALACVCACEMEGKRDKGVWSCICLMRRHRIGLQGAPVWEENIEVWGWSVFSVLIVTSPLYGSDCRLLLVTELRGSPSWLWPSQELLHRPCRSNTELSGVCVSLGAEENTRLADVCAAGHECGRGQ